MGYTPPTKRYLIEFTDCPGLEISCVGMSIGEMTALQTVQQTTMSDQQAFTEQYQFLTRKILSWTLQHPVTGDEGCHVCGLSGDMPLPVSVESLMCLDVSFLLKILNGYVEAVAGLTSAKKKRYDEWFDSTRGEDAETRRASKPVDIARAELFLGLMERFNYPNLAAVYAEDASILQLLRLEAYGEREVQRQIDEQHVNEQITRYDNG